ncbi:MAG: cyclic nucleotide-binding domain-containing protein [Campylobacterota bacterium]
MARSTTFLQALALFVLLAFLPVSYFLPNGTALVWTIVIPMLPLFIVVVGYNRWRKLCPLAWIAAVGQFLQWVPKRRVSDWFERNYYTFQFSLLFLALSARLLLLNFEGTSLALFFLAVALLAFLTNLLYAGKSWCNFFCPVGVVEKIYCGSNALLSHQTSACDSCVACKSNCPDIDLEKGYWKENGDASKRMVFYAFGGLVFGFYAYFYAISGSWDYYFQGTWSNPALAYSDLLSPGFFFLPIIPKLIAAPLTLLFFSVISYLLFAKIEKLIPHLKWAKNKDPKSVEHIVKAIVAFTAFNLFYLFAGAPTFSHYPVLYALFHFTVIVVSSVMLWKELFREERFYLQERFAQKILSKWNGLQPAPTNLKEIYYTYANQQENQLEKLDLYKETVLELLSDGTLSKEDFTLLDKIREQLGLTEGEHKKVLRSLKRDNSNLFDEENALTSEKIFQLKIYKEHLQELLEQEVNADEFQKVQQRFHINDEEHQRIYNDLVHGDNNLEERVTTKLKQLHQSAKLIAALSFHQDQKSAAYLLFTLSNSFEKKFKLLCNTLTLLSPADKEAVVTLNRQIHAYFNRTVNEQVEITPPQLFSEQYNTKLHLILDALQDVVMYDEERLTLIIREHLAYQEEELTTAILYYFYEHELYKIIDYRTYSRSECSLIAEITRAIRERSRSITRVEIMAYLHMVPIFSRLDAEELYQLSKETKKRAFKDGSKIVKQGDDGDSFYIITSGSADVSIEKHGRHSHLATLKEGEYIGEVSIVSNTKRTATVTAKGDVQTLRLSAHTFDKLLNNNPHLALRMMKDITARLLEQNSI